MPGWEGREESPQRIKRFETKKRRKLYGFFCLLGRWGGVYLKPGKYDLDWKLDKTSSKMSISGNYRGTHLSYDMLCEPYSSEN